ncbi:MAG: hypothetical protein JJ971_00795 [Balneolaceae bacterium]|nr:hypothetical protein [Balneolaceae bacterium]MBO6544907.1 hypothetical protein [Balneolaceae bacterium]MBO6646303.1 hypothetical protein [Balneolaceae bacterium]
MKAIITISLLLVSNTVSAQSLADLSWMNGYWTQEKNGTSVEELWTTPDGGIMLGVNRSIYTNGRSSFEFFRIIETQGKVLYMASPGGQAPTSFTLTEVSSKKVVFENMEHDFPQRVIYSRNGNSLTARIEDATGEKGMQWTWTKTKFD